jgi:hypothetical protein
MRLLEDLSKHRVMAPTITFSQCTEQSDVEAFEALLLEETNSDGGSFSQFLESNNRAVVRFGERTYG